ncbi:hypothetical protein IWQ60_006499 [Tieghemiomyces parasiticus]|uniref:Zinc knuckle-domain-containing protein n=1 Tax=Tieghemiomyces parasiticus TaxID=78921 RepID=A0A9W8DXJ1_9FUNG|nr:hypothetical protein IWQ60_006499 [Tieghemiomyces parasiticus]
MLPSDRFKAAKSQRKATSASGPPLCQKCLQPGHWTYECRNSQAYQARPSRTSQLRNPLPLVNPELPPEFAPRRRKAHKSRPDTDTDSTSDTSSQSDTSSVSSRGRRRTKRRRRYSSDSSPSLGSDSDSTVSRSVPLIVVRIGPGIATGGPDAKSFCFFRSARGQA